MENLKKILIFNIIIIFCLTALLKVKADNIATTQLSLAITGGSLTISAPQTATFAGKSFSFNGQTSSNNPLGNITITDARGSRVGWIPNIDATDWQDAADNSKTMRYSGNGTSEGRLSINIPTLDGVSSIAGDGKNNLVMGSSASFAGGTAIQLLSAPNGEGSGSYVISGISADQFIPGNQPTGSYATDLTLTIS